MVYQGSLRTATRLSIERTFNGFGTMSLVDYWVFGVTADTDNPIHMRVWRDATLRTVFILLADGDLSSPMSRSVKPHALFRFLSREMPDDVIVREVARHIVRSACDGRIPLPPNGELDIARWEGAFGAALAFIERFGIVPTGTIH